MDNITWEEPLTHRMKVERNLNFSTISNEEDEFGFSRKKTARDPMSHRIIEKRRRDRMNNCLADLSRLVPTNYLKKGRGRIEKTEIIEMAIKHLKHLQAHPCKDPGTCEVAKTTDQDHKRQYRLGYQECMSETVRFMVESEGVFSGDAVCVRLINHLQKHYEKVAGGLCYSEALGLMLSEDSKSNIHMEVDNHSNSGFQTHVSANGMSEGVSVTSYASETKPSELKQEVESVPPPQTQPEQKVPTSQLREMLQNPGLPKENRFRPDTPSGTVPPTASPDTPKHEEGYYKFKNNIKHRFHNDIQHHNSSPTDSNYLSDRDRMSLPDEDSNPNQVHVPEPYRPGLLTHSPDNSRGHAFSPYPPSHPTTELSVKIPGPPELHHYGSAQNQWDSHMETGSSCGSNPSPPPNAARSSNGSSSGYSTNGDNSSSKPQNDQHSPALSPYSRTSDRLSNRSPSPLHPTGVPIFALHPKGSFYIPLTVEPTLLIPYLSSADDTAPVLHPISICVNLSSHSLKVEKVQNSGSVLQYRPSFIIDKFQDRCSHQERNAYYSTSPNRTGCV